MGHGDFADFRENAACLSYKPAYITTTMTKMIAWNSKAFTNIFVHSDVSYLAISASTLALTLPKNKKPKKRRPHCARIYKVRQRK